MSGSNQAHVSLCAIVDPHGGISPPAIPVVDEPALRVAIPDFIKETVCQRQRLQLIHFACLRHR